MRSLKESPHKLQKWINQHRISVMIISGAVAIFTVGNIAMALLGAPAPVKIDSPVVTKKPAKTYDLPLTGLKTTDQTDLTKPVTTVMIENSPDARPQSGLKEAEIIYEAVAEGGITRFLAIYQKNKPQLIGPVRSVRPYYVEWYKPYDASMAHIGGSQKALQEIRNGSYRDIDQFFNAGTYWRVTDRAAPHNVYTSFEKLDALNVQKGYISSKPTVFARKDPATTNTTVAHDITVNISSPTYNSSYLYNAEAKNYTRSQGGAEHLDREKGAITPSVIIVMKVTEQTVQEETARQSIVTTGEGAATIFQQGQVIEGTWKRASTSDQLQFYDASGTIVELARGQTWLTAISNTKGSVSWK